MRWAALILFLTGCGDGLPFVPVGTCPSNYVKEVQVASERNCTNVEKKIKLAVVVLREQGLLVPEWMAEVTLHIYDGPEVGGGDFGRYYPEGRIAALSYGMDSLAHELLHNRNKHQGSSDSDEEHHLLWKTDPRYKLADMDYHWNVGLIDD